MPDFNPDGLDELPVDDWPKGAYGFAVYPEAGRRSLWIKDPIGCPGCITTHTVTEHEDGTVTVSPSILDPAPGGWHGWLERGVWRQA